MGLHMYFVLDKFDVTPGFDHRRHHFVLSFRQHERPGLRLAVLRVPG